METINARCVAVRDALGTLIESLRLMNNPVIGGIDLREQIRDSVIKRFEYSMDSFWKYLREYVEKEHSVVLTIISPNSVFRACLTINLIDQAEFDALQAMVRDRNLTSHTYNEDLAQKISEHVVKYYSLMETILTRTLK